MGGNLRYCKNRASFGTVGYLVYAAFFMRGPEFDSHGDLKSTVKLFKGKHSKQKILVKQSANGEWGVK